MSEKSRYWTNRSSINIFCPLMLQNLFVDTLSQKAISLEYDTSLNASPASLWSNKVATWTRDHPSANNDLVTVNWCKIRLKTRLHRIMYTSSAPGATPRSPMHSTGMLRSEVNHYHVLLCWCTGVEKISFGHRVILSGVVIGWWMPRMLTCGRIIRVRSSQTSSGFHITKLAIVRILKSLSCALHEYLLYIYSVSLYLKGHDLLLNFIALSS